MKRTFEKYRYWMKVPAMTFLGMIFIVAGVGKIFFYSSAFSPFPFIQLFDAGLPLAINQFLFAVLPYVEIVIGAMLVHGFMVKFANTIAASMVGVFLINNIYMVSIGRGREPCHCFGMAGGLTYIDALVIDIMMAVMVAVIFFCHKGSYFNLTPWFLDSQPIGAKQKA